MQSDPSKLQDFRIARLSGQDSRALTDNFRHFRSLILESELMYPGIRSWFARKVAPGLATSERIGFIGYLNNKAVVSAVVKKGIDSKFCHLKINDDLQGSHLGELFFTLMAMELRSVASKIHFTLPESLWVAKNGFFKSFGFNTPVHCSAQYRLFDEELRCSASFETVWRAALDRLPTMVSEFSIGKHSPSNSLVMSLHPDFAEKILLGQKTVELRRKFSKRWIGHRVTLYASRPKQLLLGDASIQNVVPGKPEEIWQVFSGQIACSRDQFEKYAGLTETLYAVIVSDVHPYREPIPLSQLSYLIRDELVPPQSYCSTLSSDLWSRAVSIAALLHASHQGPSRPTIL